MAAMIVLRESREPTQFKAGDVIGVSQVNRNGGRIDILVTARRGEESLAFHAGGEVYTGIDTLDTRPGHVTDLATCAWTMALSLRIFGYRVEIQEITADEDLLVMFFQEHIWSVTDRLSGIRQEGARVFTITIVE